MTKIQNSKIKILAIETSCDETAAAVIRSESDGSRNKFGMTGFQPIILSNVISSQIDLHAKTGGVVPEVASRAHMEAIIPVVTEALLQAGNPNVQKSKSKNILDCHSGLDPESRIYGSQIKFGMTNQKEAIDYLKTEISHIAVTAGPGLIGSLLVGFNAAKSLAYALDLPIIPVNHIEGHIYSAMAERVPITKKQSPKKFQYNTVIPAKAGIQSMDPRIKSEDDKDSGLFDIREFEFPLLALVVSGGHTSLIYAEKPGKYRTIGATLDDAAGEAFDKVAKLLDLGYPGGPIISEIAQNFREKSEIRNLPVRQASPKSETNSKNLKSKCLEYSKFKNLDIVSNFDTRYSNLTFPRPLLNDGTFHFSFSGLKTAALREVQKYHLLGVDREVLKNTQSQIATAFEDAVVDVLVAKTMCAVRQYRPKTVVLAGGVAANSHLRRELEIRISKSEIRSKLQIPPIELCGDNAAMIGLAAYSHASRGDVKKWSDVKIDSNWEL